MKKRTVGIYVGDSFVSAALVEGRNLISFSKFSLSAVERESKEKTVNNNILWEALINKNLREINRGDSDVYVSLLDKEFIFRYFEMPLMRKKEIESSLAYEIEKYIPFKIGDLVWDYSYSRALKHKKVNLSFLGIKRSNYKKYRELFTGLNIEPVRIEPSAISLTRVLKSLKAFRGIRNFVLLDVSEIESYITFFYNDLPIFNRYLSVVSGEKEISVNKLKEEIRLSIQYFMREFKEYSLDKLIVLCNSGFRDAFSSLSDDLGMDILILSPEKVVKAENITVECIKAYAAAMAYPSPAKFNPMLGGRDDIVSARESISLEGFNFPLIGGVASLGVLACISLSVFLGNDLSIKEYELKKEGKQAALSDFARSKSLESLKDILTKKEDELNELKMEAGKRIYVSSLLTRIPVLLTSGLWLDKMHLYRSDDGRLSLAIYGYIFLPDAEEQRESFDEFINNLKQDDDFRRIFSRVDIVSLDKAVLKTYNVIKFGVKLD